MVDASNKNTMTTKPLESTGEVGVSGASLDKTSPRQRESVKLGPSGRAGRTPWIAVD